MSMNDAVLLAALGLMMYGIAKHLLKGDEFWFSPTGYGIGAISLTVVINAAYPLALQDNLIILVAVTLSLYWFTKGKRTRQGASKATFEQVFETVEVEPIGEPEVETEPVVEYEAEPEVEQVVETIPFTWNGA